jgi:hypothetical protein
MLTSTCRISAAPTKLLWSRSNAMNASLISLAHHARTHASLGFHTVPNSTTSAATQRPQQNSETHRNTTPPALTPPPRSTTPRHASRYSLVREFPVGVTCGLLGLRRRRSEGASLHRGAGHAAGTCGTGRRRGTAAGCRPLERRTNLESTRARRLHRNNEQRR